MPRCAQLGGGDAGGRWSAGLGWGSSLGGRPEGLGAMDLGASACFGFWLGSRGPGQAAGCYWGCFSATGAFAALATGWQQMLGKRISALECFQENLRISQQLLDQSPGQQASPPPTLRRAREAQHHLCHAALRARGFPRGSLALRKQVSATRISQLPLLLPSLCKLLCAFWLCL